MTFGIKCHVQKSRVFVNSKGKIFQVNRMMNFSKGEVKHQFLKGVGFANNTNGHLDAQVLSGPTAWKGTRNVGLNLGYIQPVTVNEKKVCSGVVSSDTSVLTILLPKCHVTHVDKSKAFIQHRPGRVLEVLTYTIDCTC